MVRSNSAGRIVRLVFSFVCALSGLTAAALVHAQSPAQLETFRNLPPDQQQAVLEALGGNGSGMVGGEMRDTDPRARERRRSTDRTRATDRSRATEEDEFEADPRFKGGDTLLLSIEIRQFKGQEPVTQPANSVPPAGVGQQAAAPGLPNPQTRDLIERSDAEVDRLEELRTRILRRNPIELDKWGILTTPELGSIPLAGLTQEEAQQRLAAESLLADFLVKVTRLPLEPIKGKALKAFGHDLFDLPPDTFAPLFDIPVPSDYVVGPGDTFEVQFVGTIRGRYSLVVKRDGSISFPELGAIAVAGMRFEDARSMLEQRVAEQLIGTQVSIHMGELRSIQVFVVGEAQYPGSYTVGGLSTVTHALFASGGVREIGSLRNIQVKRNGETVTRFDLYDLLLRGDTRGDVRLMSGDVILIPPVGPRVSVSGEVLRPAIYELKGESTAADLVALAGGKTAEAREQLTTVERIDESRRRSVLDVDLQTASGFVLRDGDRLHVPSIRTTLEDAVVLNGHVHRPGEVQHREGLRISDVIPSLEDLKPLADAHYLLIRRETVPLRRIEYISADLVAALESKGSDSDLLLHPRDQIFVFELEAGRERILDPLLRELRLQSTREAPTAEVGVGGRVNFPGQYPLESGMRVSDLIRAGGSLNEAAYGGRAELTRNATQDGESRQTQLVEIDLAAAIAGDAAHDIELQPFDYLMIKELPLWGAQEYVALEGEVRFPGRYPIQRGETLKSVIARAGGLNDLAFSEGTVFTRESLKERERKQIDELIRRLQTDLAQVSLMSAQESRGDAAQALAVGQQLLENLRDAEPVGRLVIDLEKSTAARQGSAADIVLKDGDRLLVPRITQEVTVIGEVQSPTSHLFSEGFTRDDYIQQSGGTTQRADRGRIYVVRADGSVVSGSGNSWFSGGVEIRPGDTIVVPLDAERMRALPLWTAVTTIIYNLAVAVAAVNSF
jgi:polysaccharide biosynthesis/export protein